MLRSIAIAAVAALSTVSTASAYIEVVENFNASNAGWTLNSNATAATYVTTGGPAGAGDAYITGAFPLTTGTSGFPVAFRATGSNNPSGGAFRGNYDGVSLVSFYFQHNAPVALPVALRLGGTTGGVGLATKGQFVEPNVWTLVQIPLNPTNFESFEGTPGATNNDKFINAVSSVANFQIYINLGQAGYTPPAAAQSITVSLDAVAVPEPTVAALGLPALALLARRRRA